MPLPSGAGSWRWLNQDKKRRGQHARICSPQGSPSPEAAFGEDPGGGFFQRCLTKNRGSTPAQQRLWRDGIYDQIREVVSLQGSLSIKRMCQMVPVSRRGFYRSLKEQQPVEEEMEVRSAIQQIALEHRRRYGYRRHLRANMSCASLV
jgi:hypothetical protein